MAYVSLDSICDIIKGYNDVVEKHGFVANGDGEQVWSHRYTRGDRHIDINAVGWYYYEFGELTATGKGFKSLDDYLTDIQWYHDFNR